MSDQPVSGEFVYADTDVPAGMTIGEWRAQRVADGAAPRRGGGQVGPPQLDLAIRMSRKRRGALPLGTGRMDSTVAITP